MIIIADELQKKTILTFCIAFLYTAQVLAQLVSQNRMLCAYGDYEAARGLNHDPEDLEKMEELGVLAASIHIADPVEFWREITGFYNVRA